MQTSKKGGAKASSSHGRRKLSEKRGRGYLSWIFKPEK